MNHTALISISVDLLAGKNRLEKVVSELKTFSVVSGISSIYKKYLNQRSEDLNSTLVLVLKVETELTDQDLFEKLDEIEEKLPSASAVLLCFDRLVRLTPGQNLPSPLLHTDPLTLRCASEVWGVYEHPVLGQTLNELVRSLQPLSHVEFFAQGRSLFTASETL